MSVTGMRASGAVYSDNSRMSERALTPAMAPGLEDARARVEQLEIRLAEREAELAAFKTELRTLQDAYLDKMGAWQAQLAELDAAVAEEEIRAGLRPAEPADGDDEDVADEVSGNEMRACASRHKRIEGAACRLPNTTNAKFSTLMSKRSSACCTN